MNTRTLARQYWVALKAMTIFTVVLGIGYTAVITGAGQLMLPAQANGSPVMVDGRTVGSSLIGQSFTDTKGAALADWFQSRPSKAGNGYDATTSSGSNYGPENKDLIAEITDRRAAIAKENNVAPATIPDNALTSSASGLDPHISPAYALLQVDRVAAARHLPTARIRELVESVVQAPDAGYLGEQTVNVLQLNIALAGLKG